MFARFAAAPAAPPQGRDNSDDSDDDADALWRDDYVPVAHRASSHPVALLPAAALSFAARPTTTTTTTASRGAMGPSASSAAAESAPKLVAWVPTNPADHWISTKRVPEAAPSNKGKSKRPQQRRRRKQDSDDEGWGTSVDGDSEDDHFIDDSELGPDTGFYSARAPPKQRDTKVQVDRPKRAAAVEAAVRRKKFVVDSTSSEEEEEESVDESPVKAKKGLEKQGSTQQTVSLVSSSEEEDMVIVAKPKAVKRVVDDDDDDEVLNLCLLRQGAAPQNKPPKRRIVAIVKEEDSVSGDDSDVVLIPQDENSGDADDEILTTCERLSNRLRRVLDTQGLGIMSLLSQEEADSIVCPENRPDLTLKPYQVAGLNWMLLLHQLNLNAVLADEMGLGKTIQAIAFLRVLEKRFGAKGSPHLIVVPASVVENWRRECENWLPDYQVMVYHGSMQEREALRDEFASLSPDVVICTYTVFDRDSSQADRSFLYAKSWTVVVLDEAHSIKNPKSNRYKRLMRIQSQRRLLLSGTPVQNKTDELLALLVFCFPGIFKSGSVDFTALAEVDRARFRRVLSPFVLRRRKADVLKHLTPKVETVVMLDMEPEQAFAYKEQFAHLASEQHMTFTHKFTALRKLANHLLLGSSRFRNRLDLIADILWSASWYGEAATKVQVAKEVEKLSSFEISCVLETIGSDRARSLVLPQSDLMQSAKAKYLCEALPRLIREGHFVLVFSQWTLILDLLETLVDRVLGLGVLRLDGDTPVIERQGLVDAFNAGSCPVFLLSTRAGGLGLNLTKADTVILHDLDWNASMDSQAEDRAHRIGQTKEVQVIKLVVRETVDEGIFRVSESKKPLDKLAETDLSGQAGELLLPALPDELEMDDEEALKGEKKEEMSEEMCRALLGA